MKQILEILIVPIILGLLVVWGIIGLGDGTGTYKDYAWALGILAAAFSFYWAIRLHKLQEKMEELESSLKDDPHA